MRPVFAALLTISILALTSCNSEQKCPDRKLVNDIDCPQRIEKVCGCNGVTYDNACEAEKKGMWVQYEGECIE